MAETASPDLGSGFDTSTFSPPQISLPKGGGALRGIGETFSANGAKGTASFSVPLGLTAARSGFMPQLSLDYDSGAGNGIFGMGWNVSLPAISRRTDKGLPQYRDFEESDIFDLSGAEDLVLAEGGHSEREGYSIRRYRPRVEQAFARIERWTRTCDGETHWRVFSKDNVCALYGTGPESRISDPEAPGHVFTWLLASSFDARGNAILYEYAAENARGVDCSGSQRLRSHDANRHLKRVRYGNRVPLTPETPWSHASWMFSVVLDYGEEDYRNLPPDGEGRTFAHFDSSPHGELQWPAREDPFSTYRAGFEVRTNRLCRRILMLHHFPEELGTADCMVRSTELEYTPKRTVSLLTRILNSGYERSANGLYLKRSLPPLEFEFSASPLEDPRFDGFELQDATTENLPEGIDGASYRWVDLDGEGIAGVLADHGSGWYYKRNLGRGRFAPAELLYRPSTASLSAPGQQLMDIAGDGKMNVVELAPEAGGFHERTTGERWAQFRLFKSFPPLNWDDPNVKFVDITGDGIADILVTEEIAFRWYPSLLHEGFGSERRVPAACDEEEGPRVVFSDPEQSIYLADMTGDGLADIVRIRNGEVCYWPNLGYGRFGRKVTMDGAPWFDEPGVFDQQRIRLADTDGSGTADILYIAAAGIDIYLNQSGISFSAPRQLRRVPTGDIDAITVTDFLGRGTACVLWSSPLPSDSGRPLRYVDLMCGRKPHLLTRIRNNFGSETLLEYASSTEFYLADRAAGRPWVTRLPFPVHVVKRSHVYDFITRNHFVSSKTFHHGYFDGVEREFRGFGCIEQLDTEEFVADESGAFPPADNHAPQWRVPPTLTKTWYHTGILDAGAVSRHLAHEYYREPDESSEMLLDDTILPAGLSSGEAREAARALKGLTLRREVYALDGSPAESPPY
jgi:hypothetical protein